MITISLCMIVKNEESVLARCLESIKDIVDEIIIVETGSTDNTKKIAYQYTQKVYDFPWENDFSLARNYSFSKATKEYQLWLDADDIITQENKEKILKLKKELNPNVDILTSTRERLFKREKHYVWNDPVHEYIELKGNIYYADDIFISHKKEASYTDRNLKIYEKQIQAGKALSPRNQYYYARELKDHKRYIESIYYFEKFLDGNLGWVEDNIAFGYYFTRKNDYQKASNWFLLATHLEKNNTLGFLLNDYWEFIPNIELSVCYYKLGNLEKAIFYNDIASKYKPNSEAVLHNKKFFASLKNS